MSVGFNLFSKSGDFAQDQTSRVEFEHCRAVLCPSFVRVFASDVVIILTFGYIYDIPRTTGYIYLSIIAHGCGVLCDFILRNSNFVLVFPIDVVQVAAWLSGDASVSINEVVVR